MRSLSLKSLLFSIALNPIWGLIPFYSSSVLAAQSGGAISVDRIRASAEKGEISAQLQLGRMYDQGDGVPQDAVQSVYWFQQAAQRGDATGLYLLGSAYDKGKGVLANKVLAFVYYDLAVRRGGQLGEGFSLVRDLASQGLNPAQLRQAQSISSAWTPESPLPSLTSLSTNAPIQSPPAIAVEKSSPQRWEYKIVISGVVVGTQELNAEGRNGWELVAAIPLPSPDRNLPAPFQLIYKRKY